MTTKRDVLMTAKWASQLGMLPQARELGLGAVVVEVDVKDWTAFAVELARWGTVALETISFLGGAKALYAVVYVDGADDRELAALSQRVGNEPRDKRLQGLCGDPSVSGGCARPQGHTSGGHSMYPILDDPDATPIPELLNIIDANRHPAPVPVSGEIVVSVRNAADNGWREVGRRDVDFDDALDAVQTCSIEVRASDYGLVPGTAVKVALVDAGGYVEAFVTTARVEPA